MRLGRFLLLLSLTFSSASSFAQSSAAEILATASNAAKKENKKVFVIFHASWCGWCHKMDASLTDSQLKPFFDSAFVITHLTVLESPNKKQLENKGAEDSLNAWGGADGGIPYWVIFNSEGTILADSRMKNAQTGKLQNSGCPASPAEVDHLISVLQKTTNFSPQTLHLIKARFLKNQS